MLSESILTNKHTLRGAILLSIASVGTVGLSGCMNISSSTFTSIPLTNTPDLVITSTFTPANNLVNGLSEVPAGMYLFVEFWTYYDGEKDCSMVAFDYPYYRYSSGMLTGSLSYGTDVTPNAPVIGYFGYRVFPSSTRGFGEYSTLTEIQALPYQYPYPSHYPGWQPITIHSVNVEGVVVAEIEDNKVLLKPGQSWFRKEDSEMESECHVSTTYSIINNGLLDENQVELWVNNNQ